MNIENSQDIKSVEKNPLHVYALTIKYQKEKLRNQSHTYTTETKRIKYLGINLPKETKELYQKITRH